MKSLNVTDRHVWRIFISTHGRSRTFLLKSLLNSYIMLKTIYAAFGLMVTLG